MRTARQAARQEAQISVLTNDLKIKQAHENIEKYRKQLRLDRQNGVAGAQLGLYHYTIWTGALAECYKTIGDIENMKKYCLDIVKYVKEHTDDIAKLNKHDCHAVQNHYKNAHFLLAPYSFHFFLLCMEWNYPPEMKFYQNRYCVMHKWAQEMERLENGQLDILGLSAPPRSGKSGLENLFMMWVAGRHPDKSILFATHTNAMAVKMQQDFYNMAVDPKREYSRVFPGLQMEKSAEYLWLDISPKSMPNNYKTIYFRGIDGSFAGVLEASQLIVVDDLIKNIEEAMNPARLDVAWQKYGTDISQRRTDDGVRELHLATRWSINDVVTRLEDENEDNPKAEFIKVPGLNAEGESNFDFPYRPMSKEHFEKLRNKMDEVSFECIIQQNPMERDGLVFTKDSLTYYEGELPIEEPDEIVFACDPAFGGGDFLSMPIGYVYGLDVYIHDVVHSDGVKETTRPLVINAIISNKCARGFFEGNNSGLEYSEYISKQIKKRNYRCLIESRMAPTTQNKLSRILAVQGEIKGNISDGSGYRLHFLSSKSRKEKPMYEMYMKHLMSFNQSAKFQNKQKDDAADATASLVTNVLNHRSGIAKLQVFSLSSLRR